MVKNNIQVLTQCQVDLSKAKSQSVILNLRDVTEMAVTVIPAFVKLQVSIRQKPAVLRLCFLAPAVGKILSENGAIRDGEISRNILEAMRGCRAR